MLNHINFYILHCLMHLWRNWWTDRKDSKIWCTG